LRVWRIGHAPENVAAAQVDEVCALIRHSDQRIDVRRECQVGDMVDLRPRSPTTRRSGAWFIGLRMNTQATSKDHQ
jgi:hypothetical protein